MPSVLSVTGYVWWRWCWKNKLKRGKNPLIWLVSYHTQLHREHWYFPLKAHACERCQTPSSPEMKSNSLKSSSLRTLAKGVIFQAPFYLIRMVCLVAFLIQTSILINGMINPKETSKRKVRCISIDLVTLGDIGNIFFAFSFPDAEWRWERTC